MRGRGLLGFGNERIDLGAPLCRDGLWVIGSV